ncbi:LLM class flavin-dependent oxidoreductase [Spongisporangium articulatum]|uniref:LLM class flavin-dependent oxidoreductase n=1 Tax=Spongisporangium articulatum TaxID=3362603 RepID=A0ABW8AM78_9ACTN
MTDYGHDLEFGSFITPLADGHETVVALAQLTERLGLDLVTFQDHPYQARFLDTWTLLSVVATRTTSVRVSPNVANLQLRPPAVLAKAAASLDLLSGGRVELGLGAGAFGDAVAGYGGPRLGSGQAVTALAEGIEIIRGIWDTTRRSVRVEGDVHHVSGAHPGPAPAHDIGIWVGAYKPRMLALTGRLGDGWLPSAGYLPPDGLADANARIDEAAQAAGRDPRAIRRLYNISGRFGSAGGFLAGPAEVWAEQLADLALGEGIGTFIVAADDPDDLRRFAGEVAPVVRELVDDERRGVRAAAPEPERESVNLVETVVPASAFDVAPTPDDGRRLSDAATFRELGWDESTRPTGPAPDPDRRYTRHEVATGQHLVDVHDHLRQELAQVRNIVDQVAGGSVDPGVARSAINEMTLRQNNWTMSTYCQSYCRVVTTHHTLEDQSMLPHLKARDPRLAGVVDRLEAEHHVIHEVLERVDAALVGFVADPQSRQNVVVAVDLLTDVLLSHLSYEERELVEPLGRLGMY